MKGLSGIAGRLAGPAARTVVLGVLLVTALAAAAFTAPGPVLQIDTGLFELGPAQGADILGDGSPTTGPDWAPFPAGGDGIFDASGNVIELFGGVTASFLKDDLAQKGAVDRTTFSGAGGSNKNNDVITDWHWDTGNVPPKDDISNAYAYAAQMIVGGSPHLILYAGFERLDPSGDSHVDIEFFQDHVALDEDPPCRDAMLDPYPCDFVGERVPGDVIVSMDFTQGGSLGSLTIREWNGIAYLLIGEIGGEGCNAQHTICGFNNGGPIDGGPWPNYNNHGDEITMLERNSFTEFGIDITALEGQTPCLSTVMGKTRSSQSFTAELKDFAGPVAFNVCGARIAIEPDGVNDVGDPHTFTVSVFETLVGHEVPAPDGTIVDVTLTAAYGAVVELIADQCASPGTIEGLCSVVFTSQTAGVVTGHASADVTLEGGFQFHVETDGENGNSDDAVKRFIDAFITISPQVATNSIEEAHTFTVVVKRNLGNGAGFAPVADGTVVDVTLTDSAGASGSVISDSCATGTVAGTCTVVFTSPTPGTVTGHASVTVVIDGVEITRSTDGTGMNSPDAVKYFAAGTLRWHKVDNAGRPLAGATFEVCRTHDLDSDTGGMIDITPDACATVMDNGAGDADPADGEFLLTGLVLGRYTVRETVPPPGYAADPDIGTADLTHASPNGEIFPDFVDPRPIVKLTEFGYTNAPTGTPTDGVVSGTTTYTIRLKNFGGAGAVLTVTFFVEVPGGLSGGSVTFSGATGFPSAQPAVGADCSAGCVVEWTGIVLGAGAEIVLTVTIEYSDVPDGTPIEAQLGATYTTPPSDLFPRQASGSPAMIRFTVQGD